MRVVLLHELIGQGEAEVGEAFVLAIGAVRRNVRCDSVTWVQTMLTSWRPLHTEHSTSQPTAVNADADRT